jgi:ribosome-associated protein
VSTFTLTAEFIPLCNLLQLAQLCGSGGEAKLVIAEGLVTVDGKIETRKRCKIVRGQQVAYHGEQISVE